MRGGEGSADLDSPDSVSKKTGMTSSYERFASILLRVRVYSYMRIHCICMCRVYEHMSTVHASVYYACIYDVCMDVLRARAFVSARARTFPPS